MNDSSKLKAGFRRRWNRPERVQGWSESNLNHEFDDPACRRAWIAALRRAVADEPGQDALDVGTGPGTIAQLWAEMGCRTTGVDFAPGMLAAGRAAAARRGLSITFVEGDAEAPPFSDRMFDVVSSRFVLFTLPHPGHAIRRWIELLRPGGRIVLVGHEHAPGARPRPRRLPRNTPGHDDSHHQAALRQLPFVDHSLGDLQVVLEAAGLRNIRRIPMTRVIAARQALPPRSPGTQRPRATPFIIVGEKAP